MTVERDNGQKLSLKASLCKRRIGATLKNRHGRPTTLDEALGAWAAKTADILVGKKHRKTKSHGYLATSYFRIRFDQLRNRTLHRPRAAAALWEPLRS